MLFYRYVILSACVCVCSLQYFYIRKPIIYLGLAYTFKKFYVNFAYLKKIWPIFHPLKTLDKKDLDEKVDKDEGTLKKTWILKFLIKRISVRRQ